MTIEETRKQILESDDFILAELEKIQVLYKMKQVIRYHHKREEEIDTESDAEHVYGMLALKEYFLPLENTGHWNGERAYQIALYHDIDEILTGDRIGYLKTQSDRDQEFLAQQQVVTMLPASMQSDVRDLLQEYEEQKTIESRFVKALDKVEPLFHLINENGKEILHRNKTTVSQNRSIKEKYVAEFPYIKRFNEVLTNHMLENGYFAPEE